MTQEQKKMDELTALKIKESRVRSKVRIFENSKLVDYKKTAKMYELDKSINKKIQNEGKKVYEEMLNKITKINAKFSDQYNLKLNQLSEQLMPQSSRITEQPEVPTIPKIVKRKRRNHIKNLKSKVTTLEKNQSFFVKSIETLVQKVDFLKKKMKMTNGSFEGVIKVKEEASGLCNDSSASPDYNTNKVKAEEKTNSYCLNSSGLFESIRANEITRHCTETSFSNTHASNEIKIEPEGNIFNWNTVGPE